MSMKIIDILIVIFFMFFLFVVFYLSTSFAEENPKDKLLIDCSKKMTDLSKKMTDLSKDLTELSKERHVLKTENIKLEKKLKEKEELLGGLKGELDIYRSQVSKNSTIGFNGVTIGLFGGAGFLNEKAIPMFGLGVGVNVK